MKQINPFNYESFSIRGVDYAINQPDQYTLGLAPASAYAVFGRTHNGETHPLLEFTNKDDAESFIAMLESMPAFVQYILDLNTHTSAPA